MAQAELEDRECAGRVPQDLVPPLDGAEPVLIETTRPELLPACVALVAHPDDERYQPLFGTVACARRCSTSMSRCSPITLAEPDKGSGIAMICTFGDTTDVTWWRELTCRRVRSLVATDGCCARRRTGSTAPRAAAAYAELAGKTPSARTNASPSCSASPATWTATPPDHAPVKFYEKGDKPLEIVTSRQWYIRNGGRDEHPRAALLARGRELQLASGLHADALRELGRAAQRRLADQPPALLRRRVSRSGTPWTATASPSSTHRSWPRRGVVAGRPSAELPDGIHRGPTRQAAWLHRRPGRDGHLGHVVPLAADRRRLGARSRPVRAGLPDGPAAAGPRHHPHLALRHGGPHRTSSTACCPGRTRPSRASSSTRTARRFSKSKGNAVVADRDPAGLRRGRGPLAGRQRPARAPTRRSTTSQMKVGRRLAIKVLNA